MVPVSVVVPLYNKAPVLLRTLRSIAAQTHTEFEVIVVNDGSTDKSESIARSFQDRRFRVISQQNAGPGAARNRGVAEAAGRIITFCDADDEWLPHHLETAVKAFTDQPNLAAFVQGYVDFPAGVSREELWRKRGLQEGVQIVAGQSPLMLHYMLVYMTPPTTAVRADVLRRWGGFYESGCTFGEDSFLMLKILLHGQVAFTLRPSVAVHRESGGLSQNLRGTRPIEPFLLHPEELEKVCPPPLLPLLREFYALRAFKAACMLGYHGEWRQAAQIRRRFRMKGDRAIPYYLSSWVCSTPLGAMAGALHRSLLGSRSKSHTVAAKTGADGENDRQFTYSSGS
jgi:GT2 family glycosyltransferase